MCVDRVGMGQVGARPHPDPPSTEREDPEGGTEDPAEFSLLAVDKRMFGRLQVKKGVLGPLKKGEVIK